MMKFTLVRAMSPYNVMLGRTKIRELRVISSTDHAMMKFPTPKGIETLTTRPAIISECRRLEEKQMLKAKNTTEGKIGLTKKPSTKESVNGEDGSPTEEVAQKRRVLGTEKSIAVTKEVAKWLEAGIIRLVKYPTWISNLVLVKKVDGTWKMCIDFKNINSACLKDYYPLSEIDLKIETVMGFQYKCFLDAYKGYHQNAGATYQCLIDSGFQSQIERNLEAYVDDMVIKSKTKFDVIANIAKTFDNLWRINMKLNPKKCSFGVTEGKLFGYMVTSKGIRETSKKKKAVVDMQSPRTLKEMQSLSEKLAALIPFLARLAERSLPFFETLKNITKEIKDEYRWTKEEEYVFQSMKRLIMELPSAKGKQKAIRLHRYFKAHPIKVITDQPIKQVLSKAETSNKLAKYSMELGAYDIMYMPLNAVKDEETATAVWTLYTDEVSSEKGAGARLVLIDPLGKLTSVAFNHLTKEVLVEVLNSSSIESQEVGAIVEEEGDNWMTPIIKCIEEGKWLEDLNEAQTLWMKINQYVMEEGVMFKKSYLVSMLSAWDPYKPIMWCEKCTRKCVVCALELDWWLQRSCAKDTSGLPCTRILERKFDHCQKLRGKLSLSSWQSITSPSGLRCGLPRVIFTDNYTQLVNDPFKSCLAYGCEEVIPAKIGMPTYQTLLFNETSNKEEICLNLDLLQERIEAEDIREAKYKKKVEQYYNKRVRPVSFKVGDFVYRKNEARRVENLWKLGPTWKGPYRRLEAYQNGSYKLGTIDDKEVP
ncbi:hypothetical protein Tco_1030480 [Tanacetum coccineum]|uniref:Reverse transcriptase domain-containing protein n=1 Tax=Tanacetum coccineum TaxID=301880 RepID=A0ABQ5G802_9ASTR